ncbi:MAG: hypothetical protein JXQ83_12610 [Candidatus Glassbacteria bacterium]|nr:hypothetical protein [Candidatus Glassbacteria bacterium]
METPLKKYPRVLLQALLAASCCLLSAAGATADSTPRIRVEASERRAPKWTVKVPAADEEYLYFVGRATGSTTLEGAEQDAAADALRQVVSMIGLSASVSYERLRREAELLLEDRLAFDGEARVAGLKRLETYYQTVYYRTADSLATRYNASLLVRYPRRSLDLEKARMEQEAARRVTMAGELLAEGAGLESASDADRALDCYLQGLKQLAGPVAILLPAGRRAGYGGLRTDLLSAARRLGLGLGWVAVGPVQMSSLDDGRTWQDPQLEASLAEAMLEHGFRPVARAAPAGVFSLLSARCREEQADNLETGFCLSRWSAAISLLGPDGNTVLVQKVLTAKGFGPDPERAAGDARRRLRDEVFDKFAGEAREELGRTFGQARRDYSHAADYQP